MDKETLNKYLRFLPALFGQKDVSLILSEQDLKKYDSSSSIEIERIRKKIRCDLLAELLNDDYCYESIENLFNSTRIRIPICFASRFKVLEKIFYRKKELIEFFDKAIEKNKIILSDKGKERLNYLKEKMSLKSFKEKYENYKYETYIEGKDVSIDAKNFIAIMNLDKEKYEEFLNNDEKIQGLTKREYVYALTRFFGSESIFENYMMPKEMEKRYYDLETSNIVDFESINNIIESDANLYEGVNLHKDLKEYLYKDMPSNLTTLEKAIYLYIKACKLFTYDEQFYAANQKGVEALKHQDINRLGEINLDNKDIVCYEFTAIYGKLLEELGINFEVDYTVTNEYGSGHNNLTFKYDKFLVEVDSVTTIFQGDLVRAKTNFPLVGLKCINKNNKTFAEFKDTVEKVNDLVTIEDMSFDDALEKYESKIVNREHIDIEEKIKIYFEKLQEAGHQLEKMDCLGYAFLLSKALFNKEERTNNLNLGVFKTKKGEKNQVKLVITCNKKSFSSYMNENKYFIYDLSGDIAKIDKNDLEYQIDKEELIVVDGKRTKVPGVEGRTWIN